ncbi:MAG: hypothetical protein ACJ8LM_04870 [Candidatus Udaeobacter sp.]
MATIREKLGGATTALLVSLLSVYGMTCMLAVPYFNWCYAREHGVVSWVFFGEVVATAESLVWPYYAVSSRSAKWSDAEKVSIKHFLESMSSAKKAVEITNSIVGQPTQANFESIVGLNRVAFSEAQQVDATVLAKLDTGMPDKFVAVYLAGLQMMTQVYDGTRPLTDHAKGIALINQWDEWLSSRDIRIPDAAHSK